MDSDDEYDISLAYDENLEAQLQQIERRAQAASRPATTPRKVHHLRVALEVVRDGPTCGAAEEMEQGVALPSSQSSVVESALVETVARLMTPSKSDVPGGVELGASSPDEEPRDARTPFQRHRKREFFSVSDLVGPLWCEVQYDYRLRSKPYLPVALRPEVITTDSGKQITLNKVMAEGHEKVMRRGEVVHKALEKEIHPVEVKLSTTTREDAWGVRFLNMLASLEALIGLGTCRELPVVGFVRGIMVVGVIDEIIRVPIEPAEPPSTPSKRPFKRSASTSSLSPHSRGKNRSASSCKDGTESQAATPIQRPLTAFFSAIPSASASASPSSNGAINTGRDRRRSSPPRQRTHRLFIRDNKTRASGTMPREENAEGGRMQLMLYKEMFDGMLKAGFEDLIALENGGGGADGHEVEGKAKMKQTTLPMASLIDNRPAKPTKSKVSRDRPLDEFTFPALFTHLQLDPDAPFSSGFMDDSDEVIRGNDLKYGAAQAKTLNDMRMVWARYCSRLGVGLPAERGDVVAKEDEERGKSDKRLALVYRHIEKRKKRRKRRKRESLTGEERSDQTSRVLQDSAMDEDVAVALAIEASLAEAKSHLRAGPSDCHPVAAQEQEAEAAQDESQMDASQVDTSLLHPESDREDLRALLVDGEDQPLEPALFPPELLGRSDVAVTTATDPGGRDKTPTPSSTTADHERFAAPGSLHSHDSSLPTGSSCDHRIIGTHSFIHSPRLLAARLDVSLGFWMGRTQPVGVDESEVSRCGWCEFEEGCEWRAKKAEEVLQRKRQERLKREQREADAGC